MNHKRRCIFGMRYLKNAGFITRARVIQTQLSDPLFSTIIPSPAVISPMLDQLAIWLSESLMKDYRNVAGRNALRAELNDLISAQCTAVNAFAQSDVNIMLQSGFELMRMPSAAPEPEMTDVKSVKQFDAGTVKIRLKNVPYYRFFEIVIQGPAGFLRNETSPTTQLEISNLPTGVILSITARAVNPKGRGPWSASLTFVVNIKP